MGTRSIVTVDGAGTSRIKPLNARAWLAGFSASVEVWNNSGAPVQWSVEYTLRSPQNRLPALVIAVAGSVVSFQLPSHGLSDTDSVVISQTNMAGVAGEYPVDTVVSEDVFTVDVGIAVDPNNRTASIAPLVWDTVTGLKDITEARLGGYLAAPVEAVRLNVASGTGETFMKTVEQGY